MIVRWITQRHDGSRRMLDTLLFTYTLEITGDSMNGCVLERYFSISKLIALVRSPLWDSMGKADALRS